MAHELDHWDTPDLVARAYNAKAVELFPDRAKVNFHEEQYHVWFLVPKKIRICSNAKEKENLQAEM